jgi:HD-GYP domain-containing protein (c-di-GMP phosphodiesterase class II)
MINEAERLKEIIRLDNELSTVQDLDILLERILTEARNITSADAGSIYQRSGDDLDFKYVQNATLTKELPPGQKLIYSTFSVKIDTQSICGYVAATGETLNIPDVYKINRNLPYHFDSDFDLISNYRTASMMTVPLTATGNDIIGVLQIINKQDPGGNVVAFDSEDETICKHFASTASMALQRAQLTRALILRLINMAELRDPKETGPHVNRVASYATEIYERYARNKGMPEEKIDDDRDVLRMAAMVHDIGKVAIPDQILKKPGKLTKEERRTMKGHTYLGAQLFLDKQSPFDEVAAQTALRHHENWDGTGYPGYIDVETGLPEKTNEDGDALPLAGEDIPLFGRVVALADVYDALSSKRAYKEPWPEKEVLAEIEKERGKKFDPEVVDAFKESLDVIRSIAARYPDEEK